MHKGVHIKCKQVVGDGESYPSRQLTVPMPMPVRRRSSGKEERKGGRMRPAQPSPLASPYRNPAQPIPKPIPMTPDPYPYTYPYPYPAVLTLYTMFCPPFSSVLSRPLFCLPSSVPTCGFPSCRPFYSVLSCPFLSYPVLSCPFNSVPPILPLLSRPGPALSAHPRPTSGSGGHPHWHWRWHHDMYFPDWGAPASAHG